MTTDHRYTVQTLHDADGRLYTLCRVMRLVRWELCDIEGKRILARPPDMEQGEAVRKAAEFVEGQG